VTPWRRAARPVAIAAAAAALAWSCAPLAWLLAVELPAGGVWTGAEGAIPADEHQYLMWIAQARDRVFAGNGYAPPGSDAVLLHPLFTPSGLLAALGVDVRLAYVLWKPVAVAVLVVGAVAWAARFFGERRGALAVAVLAALLLWTPAELLDLGGRVGDEVRGIAFPVLAAGALWGATPTAISVGLMPLVLLGVERIVATPRPPPPLVAVTAAAAAVCAWLHPWQGEVLVLVLAGLVAWDRGGRRWLRAAPVAAALVAPIAYFGLLSVADADWARARDAAAAPAFSAAAVALALAPLAVVAALGLPRRPQAPAERALWLWPPAVLAVHWVLAPSAPYHAFEGLSLPLAVLLVRGWRHVPLSAAVGAAAVVALAAAGVVTVARSWKGTLDAPTSAHVLVADDARAVAYLRDAPRDGGVLAPLRVASALPALTGRVPWLGHFTWTPAFHERAAANEVLFAGALREDRVRHVVRASGAQTVFADCRSAPLEVALRPLRPRVVRFGCAAVFEL
jgi:hypothetical protein